jgi:uncharacterized RDD family membrane protein YckC
MSPDSSRAGFLRRLAAAGYDALLLGGLWFLLTLVLVVLRGGAAIAPGSPLYTAFLLWVAWLYFAFQWTHGGRTLGMKAWRLRLVRRDGGPPGWRDATLRFAAALVSLLPAGAGFLWALVDPGRLAFHDRASGTELVVDR